MLLRSFFRRSPADQKQLGWGRCYMGLARESNQNILVLVFTKITSQPPDITLNPLMFSFKNPRYPKWINLGNYLLPNKKPAKFLPNKWTKIHKKSEEFWCFFMDESTELVGWLNQSTHRTPHLVNLDPFFSPQIRGWKFVLKKWGDPPPFRHFLWHQPKLTALFFRSLRGIFPQKLTTDFFFFRLGKLIRAKSLTGTILGMPWYLNSWGDESKTSSESSPCFVSVLRASPAFKGLPSF